MKAYFTKLFNYDRHANTLMADLILKTTPPEKAVQLLAHLLAAQQVWLNRCLELTATVALWPDWPADSFAAIINDNSNKWLTYIDQLQPNDFEKLISYKNSRGDSFENSLTDILGHVINHGTHHRAQIGQLLKGAGADLPFTDYIFYIRTLNS